MYYDRQDRIGGKGKLTFVSRIKYAMDAITSFSYKPLRLSFGLAALGFVLAIVFGIGASFSDENGLAYWMVTAISLMSSAFLLCVGILGEYVGRVYDEVRQRPLSIVNRVYRPEAAFSAPRKGPEFLGQLDEQSRNKAFPAA